MLEIYRELRHQGAGVFEALRDAFILTRGLRRSCVNGYHRPVDVWDHRCWHERLDDKIEGYQAKDPWADPDFTWTPREPHGLDELEPVSRPASQGAVDSAHWWRQ